MSGGLHHQPQHSISTTVSQIPFLQLRSKQVCIVSNHSEMTVVPACQAAGALACWPGSLFGDGLRTSAVHVLHELRRLRSPLLFVPLSIRPGQLDAHQPYMLISPICPQQSCVPAAKEQELRGHLGSFGIKGALATCKMSALSGGQAVRVGLAAVAYAEPHLLVLVGHTYVHVRCTMKACANPQASCSKCAVQVDYGLC